MTYIQSPRNALVKRAMRLAANRRRRGDPVLVEGPKAIADAARAGARFELAFTRGEEAAPQATQSLKQAKVPVYGLAPDLFDKLAATETSQGLVAIAWEPEVDPAPVLGAAGTAPLAVLDRIQDPGNVGTILRTAAALGFRGAALTTGTADPFAPKAVRAAAGTVFRLPVIGWPAEPPPGFHVVAAAEGGDPPHTAFAPARTGGRPVALVVGNEGAGVDAALLARAHGRVWIPLARDVESLNVAAAFAILAYAVVGAREPGAG